MAQRTEQISLHLNAYLTAHSSPPDAVLRELAIETVELFPTEMGLAIAPEQGTLMTLLTQLTGAVSAIEIGTFTGYSSICIARGMAPGGHLLCCDISEEWTSVARKYWEKAGLSDRIELRLGPAIDTLRSLPDEEMFDLAFIDADKGGYLGYWREVVPRVRPGGLIMVDNTFSHGRVIDAGNDNPLVIAVRDFNDHAAVRERVVHHDQPARPHPRHDLAPVAQVTALVGVDEREVERLLVGQRAQRVDGRAEPQLDAVLQASLLPVLPGHRGPFLTDVAAQQPSARGQPAGDADGGITREGADLDRRGGACDLGQQRHERTLLRGDRQVGLVREQVRGLVRQLPEDGVRRTAVRGEVRVEVKADLLGAPRHGTTL